MAERRENGAGTKPKYDKERNRWWQKISYIDHNDINKRKTIYGGSEGECKQNRKDFLKRVAEGVDVSSTSGKMTIEQWLTKWMTVYKKTSLAVTSYDSYNHQVKNHIIPEIGGIQLNKLKRIQVQEFFNDKSKTLSPGTLELIKAILADALKMAVIDGYILKSPVISIKLPASEDKEVKPLSKDEVKKLLKAAENRRLYPMIYLAIHTGARKGELAALTWKNVDFQSKEIHIRHSIKYSRDAKKYIIGSTKTDKSVRDISISDNVINELKRHKARQAQDQLRLGDVYEKNNLVFAGESGQIPSLNGIDMQFNTIIKRSGVERRTFHNLRHTFASICISKKENIKALSEVLGHSDISITYNVYGHLMPGDKEGISNTITAYIAGI